MIIDQHHTQIAALIGRFWDVSNAACRSTPKSHRSECSVMLLTSKQEPDPYLEKKLSLRAFLALLKTFHLRQLVTACSVVFLQLAYHPSRRKDGHNKNRSVTGHVSTL